VRVKEKEERERRERESETKESILLLNRCELHDKKNSLFCENDTMLVCSHCLVC
jgi:hypothetical protein